MLELLLTCHSREVIQFQNCCNKSKLAINQIMFDFIINQAYFAINGSGRRKFLVIIFGKFFDNVFFYYKTVSYKCTKRI